MDVRLEGRPVHLETPPPAISGGTLHVTGPWIIASDPDRDRIVVVDRVAGNAVSGVATLPPGAEPGRIAVDGTGRAHVVLRGIGEIYSFDPVDPARGMRRTVCAMPRGIAWNPAEDVLHVACRGGELVTLPLDGAPLRTVRIDGGDLRDVVVDDGDLYVTRFRAAELLRLDRDGTVVQRIMPTSSIDTTTGSYDEHGVFHEAEFRPAVAWRAIRMPQGGVAIVHQRASDAELQTAPGAYYTSGLCNGSIIQSAVTFVERGAVSPAGNLADASLTVDVAVAPPDGDGPHGPEGQRVAVVHAGNQSGLAAVAIYERRDIEFGGMFGASCVGAYTYTQVPQDIENPIAVAFSSDGSLLFVQQRQPAQLTVLDASGARVGVIPLGRPGEVVADVFDTGHALFHGNASRGTACASCHPEGGDDGRTWRFLGMGPRRTPAMHGEVTRTAPFHWDGDLPDLRALADTVFTGRMSGPALSDGQVEALGRWLDELPRPAASRTPADEAARRGEALFRGEAQCVACHSGPMYTNNATLDVGTGGAFQVPSLVGVAQRLPVMHDGCAQTLHERFRADCGGGDRHGRTEHLSPQQIDDLVAFLETL